MLDIKIDPQDFAKTDLMLARMLRKLDHFGKVELGEVMSTWQTQDMHRHRPFTMRWRGKKRQVVTVVRPHSLRELLGLREYYKQFRKAQHIKVGRLRRARHYRQYFKTSTRPILRAVLHDQLWQDMRDAFARAISWD